MLIMFTFENVFGGKSLLKNINKKSEEFVNI